MYKDQQIYLPLNISELLKGFNTSQQAVASIGYQIAGRNFSGTINTTVRLSQIPDITLIQDKLSPKVDDLLQDRIIVNSKVPIASANLTSDKDLSVTTFIKADGVYFYIIPHQQGDYNLNYTVTDWFGNSKTIISRLTVAPLAVVYFKNIAIPSLKAGELLKLQIYNGTAIPLNFTLTNLTFTYESAYTQVGNQTVAINLTKPVESFTDVYLSDESGNNVFLTSGRTGVVTASKLWLNFRALEQGTFELTFKVGVPDSVKANTDFTLSLKNSNVSLFATQTINVNGRVTTCELLNTDNLDIAYRKCTVEFPLSDNLDNNYVVMMSGNDYTRYETVKAYEKEVIKKELQDKLDTSKRFRNLFIVLFSITLLGLVYALLPKDWIKIK